MSDTSARRLKSYFFAVRPAFLTASVVPVLVGSAAGFAVTGTFDWGLFILTVFVLGVVGCLGGFFYTAPLLKLGYRSIGEVVIGFLFGILPVTGSYYLQVGTVDWLILLPAAIVAILIFLVILINEFADREADAAVKKRTLVVIFGVEAGVWIYRTAVIASYLTAAAAILVKGELFFAGLIYLLTGPIAIAAIRFAKREDLADIRIVPPKVTSYG